ncbi:hypothetical protein ACQP3J_30145, partial [Escherichia coli]
KKAMENPSLESSFLHLLFFSVRGKETLKKGWSFGEDEIRGGPKLLTEPPVSLLGRVYLDLDP